MQFRHSNGGIHTQCTQYIKKKNKGTKHRGKHFWGRYIHVEVLASTPHPFKNPWRRRCFDAKKKLLSDGGAHRILYLNWQVIVFRVTYPAVNALSGAICHQIGIYSSGAVFYELDVPSLPICPGGAALSLGPLRSDHHVAPSIFIRSWTSASNLFPS